MDNYTKVQIIVEIVSAVATVLASVTALIIALFGETIKNALNHPIIRISLRDNIGEMTRTTSGLRMRYYHLVFENKSPNIAHGAVPMLKTIETRKNNELVTLWKGAEVPLRWQFGDNDSMFRNLGAKQRANADLISICENELRIQSLFLANSMPPKETPGRWKNGKNMSIICTVYLRYDEGVSDDYRVEISWDGIWEDGPEYTHLEIKPVLD